VTDYEKITPTDDESAIRELIETWMTSTKSLFGN